MSSLGCTMDTGNLTVLIVLIIVPTALGIIGIYCVIKGFEYLGIKKKL